MEHVKIFSDYDLTILEAKINDFLLRNIGNIVVTRALQNFQFWDYKAMYIITIFYNPAFKDSIVV